MATTTAANAPAVRTSRLSFSGRQALWGFAFVLPALLLVLGLVAYPFFYAIYISFTDRVVGNAGSAPIRNLGFVTKKPSDKWSVEFKPDKIDALGPGEVRQIKMEILP